MTDDFLKDPNIRAEKAIDINHLAREVASACDTTITQSHMMIGALVTAIRNHLREGRAVHLRNLGRFSVQERKARLCRNFHTGEKIITPVRMTPRFCYSITVRKEVKEASLDGSA